MKVRKIQVCDAESFHLSSRHGTFFSIPKVLVNIFDFIDWWGYFEGNEIVCVWPVALDKNKTPVKNYFFTYYVGPMWAHRLPEFPSHKSSNYANKVYNSFLDMFSQSYRNATYIFSTELRDIRPFIWRNQNSKDEIHEIEVKYTAKIHLTDTNSILENFRQVRRWELKNSNLEGLEFVYDNFDTVDIIKFYNENTPQSELPHAPDLEQVLYRYLTLDKNLGIRSIRVKEVSSGFTVGFTLLGIHNGTVNIIINNVDKKYKENKSYLSTYLNYLVLEKFLEEGNLFVDFNGANSPMLADSKHSFGAQAVSYFKVNSFFRVET